MIEPSSDEDTVKVKVKIPADLSCSGKEKWKYAQVDGSVAQIVRALQAGDVDMRGSCSGHGEVFGTIDLQDGRTLLILNKDDARRYLDLEKDQMIEWRDML